MGTNRRIIVLLPLFIMRERSRIFNPIDSLYLLSHHVFMKKRKNPYAVALGRKGGRKGGPARAAGMTKEERSASARKAAKARWHDGSVS